jgi:hypothetical protein
MIVNPRQAYKMLQWHSVYEGELESNEEDAELCDALIEVMKDCHDIIPDNESNTYHTMYKYYQYLKSINHLNN